MPFVKSNSSLFKGCLLYTSEAIADQIMIMKKGRLIAHDTPQKLLAVLDGKVKERLVSQKELEQLRRDTIICYQRASAQGTLVRYLDDTCLLYTSGMRL